MQGEMGLGKPPRKCLEVRSIVKANGYCDVPFTPERYRGRSVTDNVREEDEQAGLDGPEASASPQPGMILALLRLPMIPHNASCLSYLPRTSLT